MRAVELHITGLVQGVSYRASTQARARELGLTGWVRNEADRSVRAWVQGPAPQVEALTTWCERGPSYARVEHVEVTDVEPDPAIEGFAVRR